VADHERALGQRPRAIVIAARAPDLREIAERQRGLGSSFPWGRSPMKSAGQRA